MAEQVAPAQEFLAPTAPASTLQQFMAPTAPVSTSPEVQYPTELNLNQSAMFPQIGLNTQTSVGGLGFTNQPMTPEYKSLSKAQVPFIAQDIRRKENTGLTYLDDQAIRDNIWGQIAPPRRSMVEYTVNQDEVFGRLSDGTLIAKVPNYIGGTDNQDRLAKGQSTAERWVNGIGKLVGNTFTNLLGGTIGVATGITNAFQEGRLSAIYDDSFNNWLDDLNTRMDYQLPNYKSIEERQMGLLSSLTTANFWANDVLKGLSFLTGAVLSEAVWGTLTGGAATPIVAARAAMRAKNIFSTTHRLGDAARAGKNVLQAYNRALMANKTVGAANQLRFFVTSSFYESGVEARHMFNEAMDNYMDTFQQAHGRTPNQEELAEFVDKARDTSNAVFGANVAIVGSSNFFQLGSYFGLKPSLTPKLKNFVARNVFGHKVTTKAGNTLVQTATRGNRLQRTLETGVNVLKRPVVEGVWEEGSQGVVSNAGKAWLDSRFNPKATKENIDLSEALAQGFSQAYGTTEGQKEIALGFIIGILGGGMAKGEQGKNMVFGFNEASQQLSAEQARANVFNTAADNVIKQGLPAHAQKLLRLNQASTSLEEANEYAEQGKLTEADIKLSESNFTQLLAATEQDKLDEVQHNMNTVIDSADRSMFGSEFSEISDEEFASYKSDMKSMYARDVANYKKALEYAQALSPTFTAAGKIKEVDNLTSVLALNIFQGMDRQGATRELTTAIGTLLGDTGITNSMNTLQGVSDRSRQLGQDYNYRQQQLAQLQDKLVATQQKLAAIVPGNTVSQEAAQERIAEEDKLRGDIAQVIAEITIVQNEIDALGQQASTVDDSMQLLTHQFGLTNDGTYRGHISPITIAQVAEAITKGEQLQNLLNSMRRDPNVTDSQVQTVEFLLQEYQKNVAATDRFLSTAARLSDRRMTMAAPAVGQFKWLPNIAGKFIEAAHRSNETDAPIPSALAEKIEQEHPNLTEEQKFSLATLLAMQQPTAETANSTPVAVPRTNDISDQQWEEVMNGNISDALMGQVRDKLLMKQPLTPREMEVFRRRSEIWQQVYDERLRRGRQLPKPIASDASPIVQVEHSIETAFAMSPTLQARSKGELKPPTPAEIAEFKRLDKQIRKKSFNRPTLSAKQQAKVRRHAELWEKIDQYGMLVGTILPGGVTLAEAYANLAMLEEHNQPSTTAVVSEVDVNLMLETQPSLEAETRGDTNMHSLVYDKVTVGSSGKAEWVPGQVVENTVTLQGLTLNGFLQYFVGNTVVMRLGQALEVVDPQSYSPNPGDTFTVQLENGSKIAVHISERGTLALDINDATTIEANSILQFAYLGNFSSNYKFLLTQDYQVVQSDYNGELGVDLNVEHIYNLEAGTPVTPKVNLDLPYNQQLLEEYNNSDKGETAYKRLRDNLVIEVYDAQGNWVSLMKAMHSDSANTPSFYALKKLRTEMTNKLTAVQPISRLDGHLEVQPITVGTAEGSEVAEDTEYQIFDNRTGLPHSSTTYSTIEEAETAVAQTIKEDVQSMRDSAINSDKQLIVEDVLPGAPYINVVDGAVQFTAIPDSPNARGKIADVGYIEDGKLVLLGNTSNVQMYPWTSHITQDTKGLYKGRRVPVVALRIGNKIYAYQAQLSTQEISIVPEIDIVIANESLSSFEKLQSINQIIADAGLSTGQYGFSAFDLNQDAYDKKTAAIEQATIATDIRTIITNPDSTLDSVLNQMALDVNLEQDIAHSPKLKLRLDSPGTEVENISQVVNISVEDQAEVSNEIITPC